VADAAAVAEVVVAVVQAVDAARLGDNNCFVVVARHFADVAVVRVKHLGQVGAGAVFVVLVLQVADGCSLAEYVQ
jgi:nitrogen regulatory protein PII